MSSDRNLLAIDLGGSKTEYAFINAEKVVCHTGKFETPASPEDFLNKLRSLVVNNNEEITIKKIVAAVPGVWDEAMTLKQSLNLPNYIDYPIWQPLNQEFNLEIDLHSDVELAALGEAIYGAGKGYNSMLYLNLGTGFSGALYKDGSLFKTDYSPTLRLDFLKYSDSKIDFWEKLSLNLINLSLLFSPELIVLGGGRAVNNWNEFVEPAIDKAQSYLKDKLCFEVKIHLKELDNPAIFGAMVNTPIS